MRERSYIYAIENTINGSVYVGKTTNPQKRWRDHKAAANNLVEPTSMLYRAMRKYGVENFAFTIIDEHEDESYTLETLEPKWIAYYKDAGKKVYNLTNGGDGIPGYRHTDETKSKIS